MEIHVLREILVSRRLLPVIRRSSRRCTHSLTASIRSIILMSSVAAARATQDVTAKGKHEVRERTDTDRTAAERPVRLQRWPSAHSILLSLHLPLQTILLRANIQDQLNRLLTQLEDLEELKDGQTNAVAG